MKYAIPAQSIRSSALNAGKRFARDAKKISMITMKKMNNALRPSRVALSQSKKENRVTRKNIHIIVRSTGKYTRPEGAYFNWRTAESLVKKLNSEEKAMTNKRAYYRIKVPVKDEL